MLEYIYLLYILYKYIESNEYISYIYSVNCACICILYASTSIYISTLSVPCMGKKKKKKKNSFMHVNEAFYARSYIYISICTCRQDMYVCIHMQSSRYIVQQYLGYILACMYVLLVWLVCACTVLLYQQQVFGYLGTVHKYPGRYLSCELSKIDRFPECGKNILPYLEQRSNQYDNWQRQQVCN